MLSSILQVMPENMSRVVHILDAYLKDAGKLDGPVYHSLIAKCLDNNVADEKSLKSWLDEALSIGSKHLMLFDRARRQADQRLQQGIWIAAWKDRAPPGKDCPQLLFGIGRTNFDRKWTAVFNSRKARLVDPHEPWIGALRYWLPKLISGDSCIASSAGTISYDLVTAYALSNHLPILLVTPFPLDRLNAQSLLNASLKSCPTYICVTCQTGAVSCSKARRMTCRDRLLAFLADCHWILDIRKDGNLHQILQEQHARHPRTLLISRPSSEPAKNSANLTLMETYPGAIILPAPPSHRSAAYSAVTETTPLTAPDTILPNQIEWQQFLYHYTRSCSGPWPGQSYQEYLVSLLNNEPHCGHAGLDTLTRILLEERIRASVKLIRGEQPVVSWTAVPPLQLQELRQWNPALTRWTFEPYGLAIRKELVRGSGAKPAIYVPQSDYESLKPEDRYRYQRNESPKSLWKHEREWRLPRDFLLNGLSQQDGFIFVPEVTDARSINEQIQSPLPFLVLSRIDGFNMV